MLGEGGADLIVRHLLASSWAPGDGDAHLADGSVKYRGGRAGRGGKLGIGRWRLRHVRTIAHDGARRKAPVRARPANLTAYQSPTATSWPRASSHTRARSASSATVPAVGVA